MALDEVAADTVAASSSDELIAELNELALFLVGELDPGRAAEVSENVEALLSTEWVPVIAGPPAYVANVEAEFALINRRARVRRTTRFARVPTSPRRPRPQRRESRRRSVRSGPRRARAPGSRSSDDEPSPRPLDLLDAAARAAGWERVP